MCKELINCKNYNCFKKKQKLVKKKTTKQTNKQTKLSVYCQMSANIACYIWKSFCGVSVSLSYSMSADFLPKWEFLQN